MEHSSKKSLYLFSFGHAPYFVVRYYLCVYLCCRLNVCASPCQYVEAQAVSGDRASKK